MAFIRGHYHEKIWTYQSVKQDWKLHFWDHIQISQGQWVKIAYRSPRDQCITKIGLSVDIYCWGSGAPNISISNGPKQNLEGPSIEIHYQFSNFGGSIGPSGKISQGPHGIFRGPVSLPPGAREPCKNIFDVCNTPQLSVSQFSYTSATDLEDTGLIVPLSNQITRGLVVLGQYWFR